MIRTRILGILIGSATIIVLIIIATLILVLTTTVTGIGATEKLPGAKGDGKMKKIRTKKILLGAMLAVLMINSAHGLSGCLVCRDCGPHPRHFNR
jgi:hypothetical protein